MPSRFQDKLRRIRDASRERSEQTHKVRTEEDIHRSEKTVHAFEYRESVEAGIEDLVTSFQEEAPDFVLTRGFYEGKYMLALRLDEQLLDEDGRAGSYFSRLMLLLDPRSESADFNVQCRKTIRNRDLETTTKTTPMDEESVPVLGEFIEAQFVAFAEAYFGDSSLTRPASVPT
jgi:hypothetical protein